MKKLLLALFAIVCAFVFIGCKKPVESCKHEYVDGVCSICGEKDPNYVAPVKDPYAMYYHAWESDDLGSVNYWDSKESTVGDLSAYVFAGFWDTRMNEDKDGYEWYPLLANEKPVAQNADEDGLATIYKFEVKVGSQLKYATMTKNEKLAKYNNQEVKLEDYLTPWKEMYNKSNGIERGSESLTGAGSIKGIGAYYQATENGFNEEAWNKVGIKATEENGKAYLQFEFNVKCNAFYAMYYLASYLYTPIPASFLEEIGGLAKYGTFSEDNKLSPVDTCLSTGFYVLEKWENKKEIVYKRNENIKDGDRYAIEGVYIEILEAAKTDNEAAFKEFLANKIDATSIPSTQLDKYKSDPRTTTTLDSSTFKLNVNSCTQEEWIALFGANGTITQTKPADYWQCEPIMSNNNFLRGLSYSLDRKNLAELIGRSATGEYFGSAYLSDPENGVAYNSTQAHKDAVATLLEGTDGYGYSLALAKEYFKKACDELIAAGTYKSGDEITIEIAWQTQASVDREGAAIEKYITDAFNACGGGLTLKVKHFPCAVWSDVYYKKMMVGQFDLGMGSISGNALNPINFLEVLRSDNSSGFTLNWGADTSVVDGTLKYDGKDWSYNALWQAADQGAFVADGKLGTTYNADLVSSKHNEDGTRTVKFLVNVVNTEDGQVKTELTDVVICWYDYTEAYEEAALEWTVEEGTGYVVATVPAEIESKYLGTIGFDLYFSSEICGAPTTVYSSFYSYTKAYDEETGELLDTWFEETNENPSAPVSESGEAISYVAASYEERTIICAALEKWAVENFITGLTLYGDGGYVMYQDRLVPGSGSWDNYIPGYGFGVQAEGSITKALGA